MPEGFDLGARGADRWHAGRARVGSAWAADEWVKAPSWNAALQAGARGPEGARNSDWGSQVG